MAKTREQKQADVKALAEAFSGSKIAVMTDYRGLDVPAISDLRANLREAGISYKVSKNTLVKVAIAQTDLKDADTSAFKGPMAIAFGQDEAQTCKIIADFAKSNDSLEIIGGLDESGKTLTAQDVLDLCFKKNELNHKRQDQGYKEGTYNKFENGVEDNKLLTTQQG